ncbi:hypothetical protein BKA70DRAFT_268438 [Coprinopsis sp. MPI-PUGE-AT-0042]|nr:hypothetical protein BKA70DRAFT_268438 [Coprinopsis sp. MPI-PUGE-AT-0042]
MSAERLPSVKQSKREAVKKWAKTRWDEFRSGSPSSATPPSAPPTPLGSGATGDTELGQHASGASQKPTPSTSNVDLIERVTPSVPEDMPVVGGGQSKSSPSQFDTVKDYLDVTGSFLLLVLKKVPDAVDSNPAKVVFSLAKSILELKEGMDDNANSVKNRIFAISELLQTLEAAMSGWEGSNSDDEKELMESFKQQVLFACHTRTPH